MGIKESGGKMGQESTWRGSENSNGDDQDDRAKRLWAEFLQGKITSEQLDQTVSGLKSTNRKGF